MTGGHLVETKLAREFGDALLVVAVAVGVHQHDCDGDDAVFFGADQFGAHRLEIERTFDSAIGTHAFIDLDHALVQHVRLDDMLGKDLRPRLVADAQRVAKALGDEKQRPVALAFKERIGRNRGAHFDRGDASTRYRIPRREPKKVPDAVHRRVPIGFRILRKQLVGKERAIRTPPDHIGEGTAAIDPEFPTCGHISGHAFDPDLLYGTLLLCQYRPETSP